jgi:hypothetical protein
VVIDLSQAGGEARQRQPPLDWREASSPARALLDARTGQPLPAPGQPGESPPVDLGSSSSSSSAPKWAHSPAPQQLSTSGGVPIRSRACVQRSSAAAAVLAAGGNGGSDAAGLMGAAADAKQSPSRDSTPRKADRPDTMSRFFGWVSPMLTGFR